MILRWPAVFGTLILTMMLASGLAAQVAAGFTKRVVATGLAGPWEVTWGPDNYLWITERTGKRVTRVNPANGEKFTALSLPEVHQDLEQDGLLGMALHPQLLRGGNNNYVYVYFTYDADPGPGITRRGRVRRYTYDAKTATLAQPMDLIDGLPVHNDHISGRLAFGPDNKLYLSIGDEGSNFGRNACNPNRAQETPTDEDVQKKDWIRYQGKLLRINLDGSIPADNPAIRGVRSHIYTYGHRNIQGIVFGAGGRVYTSEHGPSTDDEVNLIQAAKNYGWPNVAGYKDDKAYVYANWSAAPGCATLRYDAVTAPAGVPSVRETDFKEADFVPPLQTFFTVADAAALRTQTGTAGLSGMAYYGEEKGVSGWANSLLVTGMRTGTVYRLKLNDGGTAVVGQPAILYQSANRPRDLAVAPGGKRIFVVTDPTGRVTTSPGVVTGDLENPGALLELVYAP